jgi:hypothetical protein
MLQTINKYKTFSVLIYSYINTSGNCGNMTPEVFPISKSVDITYIYQYGKSVLYLFYNIAQRNIKIHKDFIFIFVDSYCGKDVTSSHSLNLSHTILIYTLISFMGIQLRSIYVLSCTSPRENTSCTQHP